MRYSPTVSVAEHITVIVSGAAAAAGGIYFRRRGTRNYTLYLFLFWVILIAILVAVWRWMLWSALRP
jgi:hypothetical protein